jgi:outer membrane protein assembly factor BamB
MTRQLAAARRAPPFRWLLLLILLAVVACTPDAQPPTVPPPPEPRPMIASVEIVAGDTLLITLAQYPFRAVARDSAGVEIPDVPLAWSVTSATLALVSADGVVRARREGEVGVIVTALPSDTADVPDPAPADTMWATLRVAGSVRWRFAPGLISNVGGPFALSPDGSVLYLSATEGTIVGTVHALDARSGEPLWANTLHGIRGNPPIVAPNGTIYVPGRTVYALSPAGAVLWSYETERPPDSTLGASFLAGALSPGGDTLYANLGLYVAALDARTGDEFWRALHDTSIRLLVPPTLGADGVLYVARSSWQMYGLNAATGAVLWEIVLDDNIRRAHGPVPHGDHVYFPLRRRLYAVRRPQGTVERTMLEDVPTQGVTEPVIDPDLPGVRYVQVGGSRGVHALDDSGAVLWFSGQHGNYTGQAPVWAGGAALGEDGTIYISSATRFWAIDSKREGEAVWRYPPGFLDPETWFHGAPLIGYDGTVYATTEDTLFAFWGHTRLATRSPWPMWRQNPQRTGAEPR